jgi:hypothetical protein
MMLCSLKLPCHTVDEFLFHYKYCLNDKAIQSIIGLKSSLENKCINQNLIYSSTPLLLLLLPLHCLANSHQIQDAQYYLYLSLGLS